MAHAIEWHQAQQVQIEQQKNKIEQQQKYIKEYLESDHSMMDAKDLEHYLTATGKPLSWLLENANNLSSLIAEPLAAGHTLDEIMDVDPHPVSDLDLLWKQVTRCW